MCTASFHPLSTSIYRYVPLCMYRYNYVYFLALQRVKLPRMRRARETFAAVHRLVMECRSNNSSVVSQLSDSSKGSKGDGREEEARELSMSQGDISVHRENLWRQGSEEEEDTQVSQRI